MKKRNRKKLYQAAAVTVSLVFLYGAPFSGLYALEPESIWTLDGKRVIKW